MAYDGSVFPGRPVAMVYLHTTAAAAAQQFQLPRHVNRNKVWGTMERMKQPHVLDYASLGMK